MVVQRIFEHARRMPGKVAIRDGARGISYSTFAFWIWHAREFLIRQDVKNGGIVVLELGCLIDGWVFGFALRSLGCTTVSVNSLDWLKTLSLRDIGCIVTDASTSPPEGGSYREAFKFIRVPRRSYLDMTADDFPLPRDIAFADGAHIMLTSGTTGTRKKVLTGDRQIARLVVRRALVHGLSEHSVVNVFDFLNFTGVGYKIPSSVWNLGGTVLICQPNGRHNALRAEGITDFYLTPSLLFEVFNTPGKAIPRNEKMQVYITGGPLTRELAAEIKAKLTPNLVTGISSTEVGPWAMTRIERDEDLYSHRIHPSAKVQVVDEAGRTLPPGRTGAVRIRTPDMSSRYLDDDAASRASFRGGYFYSGDLGMFEANGRLVLQGRANNVLNVVGQKISAEVMEREIQEKLAVDGVCVFSQEETGMDPRFHVVVETLRTMGERELASAIVPWFRGIEKVKVHVVDRLPRGDMGKIDRAVLKRFFTKDAPY
jgi:acyl-coenzyme A synthetase/AMP-(fatty) acid ligase